MACNVTGMSMPQEVPLGEGTARETFCGLPRWPLPSGGVSTLLAAVAVLPNVLFIGLPLISDSYTQIVLSRHYGTEIERSGPGRPSRKTDRQAGAANQGVRDYL